MSPAPPPSPRIKRHPCIYRHKLWWGQASYKIMLLLLLCRFNQMSTFTNYFVFNLVCIISPKLGFHLKCRLAHGSSLSWLRYLPNVYSNGLDNYTSNKRVYIFAGRYLPDLYTFAEWTVWENGVQLLISIKGWIEIMSIGCYLDNENYE